MAVGFFTPKAATGRVELPTVARCSECKLDRQCRSSKMPVYGQGGKKILVVGEAPGKTEDLQGRPFVGESGKLLEASLLRHGVELRKDCWITNALICFTGDVPVESDTPVLKAYRRLYTGPLVRVKTFSGRVFTGTPNHPILTPFGWVPLGLLNEGDHLICRTNTDRTCGSGADVDDPPPTFKEAFDSLSKFGDVRRVVGSRVDFHGDGENSDIDVITPNGLLQDGIESAVGEHFGEFPFVFANESLGFLFGACRFSAVPSCNVGGFSTSRVVSGSGDRRSSLGSDAVESTFHRLASRSDFDSGTSEKESEPVCPTPYGSSDGLSALARFVTTDCIVKIERKRCDETFDGDDAPCGPCHVYNLQTGDGLYYIADGIVVSNCRPRGNEIKDPKAVDHCRPNLVNAIRELQPEIIIPLGSHAVRSLIGWLWREDSEDGISRWVGWRIPSQKINAWVCPNYHPSHLLRSGRDDREDPVLRLYFDKFLERALSLEGRPWRKVPDYKKKVRLVYGHREAAREIRGFVERGNEVAWDIECTQLKPDSSTAEVLCCAISDGRDTVAFPWHGEVLPAMRDFLTSGVPKVGYNCKFETRWMWKALGRTVNNWVWDGMLAAHALDNRPGISSLKFQAFVRLGFGGYDDGVKPYMTSDNSNRPNRLKEFPLDKLLEYCALDSLLEWLVAKAQREELGWGL